MEKLLIAIVAACFLPHGADGKTDLWPRPLQSYREHNDVLLDVSKFVICVDDLARQSLSSREMIEKALDLWVDQLKRIARCSSSPVRIVSSLLCDLQNDDTDKHIRISCNNLHELKDNKFIPNGSNEHYILSGDEDGSVRIQSESPFGMLRGLQTLLQFFQASDRHACHVTLSDLPFYVDDRPMTPYRGVLIDSARRHLSVSFIHDLLGWMAAMKYNVLHWHISDDGAFPLKLVSHPELALRDTMNDADQVYSIADVQSVIHVARLYGVRVIPEFDVPGHCGGWSGVPGLVSRCPRFACSVAWSVSLSLSDGAMKVLEEVLAELFGLFPDPYFHLGGDEVDPQCWVEDPGFAAWRTPKTELFCLFEAKLHGILQRLEPRKKIIRWEEHWEQTTGAKCRHTHADVYQIWRSWLPRASSDLSRAAIAEGKRVVVSADWYLDTNCFGWEDCWRADPMRFLGLAPDQHGFEGGETCIWDFSEDMWLRTRIPHKAMAAIAGRLWDSDWKSAANVGKTIEGACLHASQRGLVPREACTGTTPQADIFRTSEYLTNKKEQERRMCTRLSQ